MSTATVTADPAAAPKAGGKKKLIIIVAAAVLLLAVAGAAALMLLRGKAASEDGEEAEEVVEQVDESKVAPTFVPLDTFTVNLADREAERYAQVGVTLAIENPAVAERIKAYMPAIRNNVLMVLAHKTSAELLQRDGKEILADEIRREASRAMGHRVDDDSADDDAGGKKKAKKKRKAAPLPITSVYFSNFIVQ